MMTEPALVSEPIVATRQAAASAPRLGLGVGWRPELAWAIEQRHDLGFVEIVAEDLDPFQELPDPLRRLRDRGVVLVPHGLALSLGGAEPPDPQRLDWLARLAVLLQAPLVSEHLAFVRGGDQESGHLLPVPRRREAVDILVENIQIARRALPVPLALENIATLFEWPEPELDEPAFLTEVLHRSNVGFLLDIENVHANARNQGFDPLAWLDRAPLGRVAYLHVAGGIERAGVWHDTHAHPVPHAVLDLLRAVARRIAIPGVMLERDDRFDTPAEFHEEMSAIAAAAY